MNSFLLAKRLLLLVHHHSAMQSGTLAPLRIPSLPVTTLNDALILGDGIEFEASSSESKPRARSGDDRRLSPANLSHEHVCIQYCKVCKIRLRCFPSLPPRGTTILTLVHAHRQQSLAAEALSKKRRLEMRCMTVCRPHGVHHRQGRPHFHILPS